jgi:Tol biopolymer transport system component
MAFEARRYIATTGGGGSFVEGAENLAAQRTTGNIYIKDPVESKPRWIDEGEFPAWSPDGTRLAFCTTAGSNYGQIRIVNADGKGKRQLTHLKTGVCFPEWSPDGKEIVVTLFEPTSTSLAIVDENGTLVRNLGPGSEAHWSPDGKQLLFLRPMPLSRVGSAIWIMRADGSDAREILQDSSRSVQASWLASGKGILFSSGRAGLAAIFTVDLEGNNLRKIAADPTKNLFRPTESPDGRSLVVEAATAEGAPIAGAAVMQVNPQTHSATVLAVGDHSCVFWGHVDEATPQNATKTPPASR